LSIPTALAACQPVGVAVAALLMTIGVLPVPPMVMRALLSQAVSSDTAANSPESAVNLLPGSAAVAAVRVSDMSRVPELAAPIDGTSVSNTAMIKNRGVIRFFMILSICRLSFYILADKTRFVNCKQQERAVAGGLVGACVNVKDFPIC